MEADLAQLAIACALSSNWKEAILVNSKIVKIDPQNIDAMNRLAKAYAEMGNIKKAETFSKKVLKIDAVNTIAIKSIQKWRCMPEGSVSSTSLSKIAQKSFIEDPSRTKIISLINLGDAGNINNLDCGDLLKLSPHTHRVNVYNEERKYIGRFPDNLALKFINLIKHGAHFEVIVKTASAHEVQVFIQATSKNGF